jgi:hypothetical protein
MALADGEEPPVLPIRDPGLVAGVVNERHFRYRAEVSSELSRRCSSCDRQGEIRSGNLDTDLRLRWRGRLINLADQSTYRGFVCGAVEPHGVVGGNIELG